ncbi:uncharacterized protein LOC135091916 [Scylla paramamosain]|uniref:uncharacterized protein LOC135091916 n=1 Tax=Scylla paramamosain TaxID=85552 RepID=UPI0030830110
MALETSSRPHGNLQPPTQPFPSIFTPPLLPSPGITLRLQTHRRPQTPPSAPRQPLDSPLRLQDPPKNEPQTLMPPPKMASQQPLPPQTPSDAPPRPSMSTPAAPDTSGSCSIITLPHSITPKPPSPQVPSANDTASAP